MKTSLDFQSGYDAAAKAKQLIIDSIRDATIEECALVAENWNGVHYGRMRELDIAAAIRDLKDKQP